MCPRRATLSLMLGRPILAVLILCVCTMSQDHASLVLPTQFEIARHTFVDVGPPNDFYELLFVRSIPSGSSIEKITLIPATDQCFSPAKVELAKGTLPEPIAALLSQRDPCAIPEKELHRELKRCKNCLVFSGEKIAMQVGCGGRTRIIRSDILDRDMFDSAPKTPKQTSWTMGLLARIDQAVGPGVWDRPIFSTENASEKEVPAINSEHLEEIAAGKYDQFFKDAPDKPSDLYRAAQVRPALPTVHLLSSTPFAPERFVTPPYPPLAKLAHVEGIVSFTININEDGSTKDFSVESGHPILRPAVHEAADQWKFSKDTAGQKIHAAVEFALNCPAKTN